MFERRNYEGDDIDIYEHPGPECEIAGGKYSVYVEKREDAEALIESLQRLIAAIGEQDSKPGAA